MTTFFAQAVQCVTQTYGSGGLAFARRCGVDGCHQNQLAVGGIFIFCLQQIVIHFCFVFTIVFQFVLCQADGRGDLPNGGHGGRLGDLNIGFESHVSRSSYYKD